MRTYGLIIISLTASFVAKKFVLLDPDDPNLEKSAGNISDPIVRTRSMKMAKFRKWLKYDVDCDFISMDELEQKISQGRCPLESSAEHKTTTTIKPKSMFFKKKRKPLTKKDGSIFSHQNKESVIRSVVGSNKMHEIDWNPLSSPDLELVSGSMISFLCDQANREANRNEKDEPEFIEWFVNGKRISPSWFDWRVSVSWDGKLGIWPINEEDNGHFECLSNGQLKASVNVQVVPMSKVLLDGLFNYLFVCAIFAVVTIAMGCLLGSRNLETTHFEVDRMEEFLAENVFKTNQMAKEKVAQLIEGKGKVDEHKLIENKGQNNRSTIMLLLQNPEVLKFARTPQKLKAAVVKSVQKKEENWENEVEKKASIKSTTSTETKKTTEIEREDVVKSDEEDNDEEKEDLNGSVSSSTLSKDSNDLKSKNGKKKKESEDRKKKKKKTGKKETYKKNMKNKKKESTNGKKLPSKGKGGGEKKKPSTGKKK